MGKIIQMNETNKNVNPELLIKINNCRCANHKRCEECKYRKTCKEYNEFLRIVKENERNIQRDS